MSKLTDYKEYKYQSGTQDKLVSIETGFFPYLPFSFDYSLKVQREVLLAADLQKQDAYKQYIGRYDTSEPDAFVNNQLMETRRFLRINKKDGDEFGKKMSDIVTESNSEVSRRTTLPRNYTGEIATEVVAQDILEQLGENDNAFKGEWDEAKITLNKELKEGTRKYIDKNPQTKQSRQILSFYKNVIKEATEYNTEGVLGIEESVGLSKIMTEMVGEVNDMSVEQATTVFKRVLKQHENEVNSVIKGTGKIDFIGARDKIPTTTGDAHQTQLNKFSREVLHRLDEMDQYVKKGLTGDRYLYTMPLGQIHSQKAHISPPRYLGMYSIMSQPINVGGKMTAGVKFVAAPLWDAGDAVFATLDNMVLQLAGKDSGLLAAVDMGEIENVSQQIINETALAFLEEGSLGSEGANVGAALLSNSVEGAVSISRVMSERQVAENILKSFEAYSTGKQEEITQLIEKMIKRANTLSIAWKKATMNGLWSAEPFDRYDWEKTKLGRKDGVWKRNVEGPWNEGDGSGLSVSPYIASERVISQDYPSAFGKRKVPFVAQTRQRRKFR